MFKIRFFDLCQLPESPFNLDYERLQRSLHEYLDYFTIEGYEWQENEQKIQIC